MALTVAFRNSFLRHTPKIISYVAVSTVSSKNTIPLALCDEKIDDFGFGNYVKCWNKICGQNAELF